MVSCQFFEVKSFEIYGAANIQKSPLPALFLRGDFIPHVFKAKNLGVTFKL
jgi:hypothetical protein